MGKMGKYPSLEAASGILIDIVTYMLRIAQHVSVVGDMKLWIIIF